MPAWDAMTLMDCLCGQNHLPGECCPHGVRDCPEPGRWMFRLRRSVEARGDGQPEKLTIKEDEAKRR
jgi:hypothetical protein